MKAFPRIRGGVLLKKSKPTSGFALLLAQLTAESSSSKPLIGKPYLRYGQCFALWVYLFEVGLVLGVKYSHRLDELGQTLLGVRGPQGSVQKFLQLLYTEHGDVLHSKNMSSFSVVGTEFVNRIGYSGTAYDYLSAFGSKKVKVEAAAQYAYQCSRLGVALGAIAPRSAEAILKRTHDSGVADARLASALGFQMPEHAQDISLNEFRNEVDSMFLEYARACWPDLHNSLVDTK